jgi:hypothetical protein
MGLAGQVCLSAQLAQVLKGLFRLEGSLGQVGRGRLDGGLCLGNFSGPMGLDLCESVSERLAAQRAVFLARQPGGLLVRSTGALQVGYGSLVVAFGCAER